MFFNVLKNLKYNFKNIVKQIHSTLNNENNNIEYQFYEHLSIERYNLMPVN